MYAELKKKVQVKKQRQQLEGQMCSLIRIERDEMSCKVRVCLAFDAHIKLINHTPSVYTGSFGDVSDDC